MNSEQSKVDKFNAAVPVGAKVIVVLDNGNHLFSTVKHPATVLGEHTAVGWVEDLAGAYDLDRITPYI